MRRSWIAIGLGVLVIGVLVLARLGEQPQDEPQASEGSRQGKPDAETLVSDVEETPEASAVEAEGPGLPRFFLWLEDEGQAFEPPDRRLEARELRFASGEPPRELFDSEHGAMPRSDFDRVDGAAAEPGAWRTVAAGEDRGYALPAGTWEVRSHPEALFGFDTVGSWVVHLPLCEVVPTPAVRLARVRGVVVDEAGAGVAGAVVVPRAPSLRWLENHPPTGKDGAFSTRVLAGEVDLRVHVRELDGEFRASVAPFEEASAEIVVRGP